MTDTSAGVHASTGQTRAAEALAASQAGKLRFVFGTPTGWHWWDGMRWQPDSANRARSALLRTIRSLGALAASGNVPISTINELQKSSSQRGALEIASNLDTFATSHEEMDRDPFLLNTTNGTLNLQSFTLQDHNPDDLLTQVTTAAYHPDATSDLWTSFLDTALPDVEVRAYLQRLIGYSLIGQVDHHIFPLLIGVGGAGKGTFYSTVMHALGDYAAPFDSALLISSRADFKNANAPAPAVLGLKGKRLVITSETEEDAKLNTSKMKFFTGGDTLTARGLHAKANTVFEPSHTMIMVSNYEPVLSSEDGAAWQRITAIPFNVKIRGTSIEIPGFTHQLKAASDAVLAWAVEGLRQYYSQGLNPPDQVLARTAQYQAKVDLVSQYIATQLTATGDTSDRVPRTEVWNDWLAWAKAEGAEPIKQSDLYAKVGEHYPQGKVAGVRVFRGLSLQPHELDDDEAILDEYNDNEE